MLYHYTSERQHLPKILASGVLRGRADNDQERPLVWFSSHPFWEPTATKPRWLGGLLANQTFEQYREMAGCARFALPADDRRLMDWRKACKFAGIPKRDRWAMEETGIKAGGNPKQWFAMAETVPLSELRLERLSGDKWEFVDMEVEA
ncbi:hypothetical protein DU505_06015 [Billgrantia montanilacus]|uniref:Uncharacterized protein n=2 Tax=Billgrantia montanilacus TaxID=2282305 RepID=A0A368U044_9GAMM|nr:hypothetical protein DU505_06015 [Halomonas montanilacus]